MCCRWGTTANPHAQVFVPSAPHVLPWVMTQATEWKFRLLYFILFICKVTHKVWYKNLWNCFCNWNQMIFDLSLTIGWKVYLHSVLLIIPVNLICHMTMFETKKKPIFDPWALPGAPKSHPGGMTQASEQKSCSICFISLVCENTQSLVKNLWNWLCYWNLMIFGLLTPPQGPRRRGQFFLLLHVPFMWVTHTRNLVGFRPIV